MPRKDGFPTNREMQVDLTSAARDVFVSAFERSIESKITPDLEDKPLRFLQFRALKGYEIEGGSPQTVENESLLITPITHDFANAMEYSELFQGVSIETIERYAKLADRLAQVALSPTLRLGEVLPSEGVEIDYWVELADGPIWHTGTLKERPVKQTLASAKYFTEEVAAYIQSDEFDKPLQIRHLERGLGISSVPGASEIEHSFTFNLDPELPINGHESKSFLRAYGTDMLRRLESGMNRIERLRNLGAPEFVLQAESDRNRAFKAAYEKASKYL